MITKRGLLVIGFVGLILLAGSLLIIYSTELGPWTMVDTVDYFDVARNLHNGHGLVLTRIFGLGKPMTIHPPFYSIVLSPAAGSLSDLMQSARVINIILFIVLVLVIILGTYYLTSSALLSISLGLWVVSNHAILRNYTAALSEPLFLTLGLASIYSLCAFIKTNKNWLMVTSALLAGLSLATRYSGAAFLVTGFLTILIWRGATWNKK